MTGGEGCAGAGAGADCDWSDGAGAACGASDGPCRPSAPAEASGGIRGRAVFPLDAVGDGTVTVPSVTLSVNGAITSASPGAPGTYTVAELVPPDDVCLGTLTFSSGNAFNLFIPLKGARIWMIQTNLNPNNSGNVFEGTARKIAR